MALCEETTVLGLRDTTLRGLISDWGWFGVECSDEFEASAKSKCVAWA